MISSSPATRAVKRTVPSASVVNVCDGCHMVSTMFPATLGLRSTTTFTGACGEWMVSHAFSRYLSSVHPRGMEKVSEVTATRVMRASL